MEARGLGRNVIVCVAACRSRPAQLPTHYRELIMTLAKSTSKEFEQSIIIMYKGNVRQTIFCFRHLRKEIENGTRS